MNTISRRTMISLALLLLPCLNSWGQGAYHSFLKEGKVWKDLETNYDYRDNQIVSEREVSFVIMGDTIVNGDHCKKLYRTVGDGKYLLHKVLFEQDRKVYNVYSHGGQTVYQLIYDFGMDIGDVMTCDDDVVKVLDVDAVEGHDGRMYRRMKVMLDKTFPVTRITTYWIEGIGVIDEPTWSYDWARNGRSLFYHFKECYEDGECVFTYDDFRYSDLGINSLASVSTQSAPAVLFDLQGRRLAAPPAKGVYIRDGKKVVIK